MTIHPAPSLIVHPAATDSDDSDPHHGCLHLAPPERAFCLSGSRRNARGRRRYVYSLASLGYALTRPANNRSQGSQTLHQAATSRRHPQEDVRHALDPLLLDRLLWGLPVPLHSQDQAASSLAAFSIVTTRGQRGLFFADTFAAYWERAVRRNVGLLVARQAHLPYTSASAGWSSGREQPRCGMLWTLAAQSGGLCTDGRADSGRFPACRA